MRVSNDFVLRKPKIDLFLFVKYVTNVFEYVIYLNAKINIKNAKTVKISKKKKIKQNSTTQIHKLNSQITYCY